MVYSGLKDVIKPTSVSVSRTRVQFAMIPSLKSSENTAFCGVGVVKCPSGGIKGMAAGADGWGREAPCGRHQGARCCVLPHAGRARCFAHCIPLFAMHSRIFSPPGVPMQDTARHIASLPYNRARLLRSRPLFTIAPASYNRARSLQLRPPLTIAPFLYFHTNILQSHIFLYFYAFVFTNKYFSYKFIFFLLFAIFLYHP